MDLAGKKIVVGMTGGIAAYKVCELVRRLQDHGADVTVVMTQGAQEFVTATTMQALSGKPVFTDQWHRSGAQVADAMPHIALSRGAAAIVVAPASAHFIAKTAHGLADDLLSTAVLARNCPLLVAPAMNVEMWNNPATQRNVHQLRVDGVEFLGPASGDQACGEFGSGRMLEPHEMLEDIIAFFQPKVLRDQRVLLTAGPTFEPIDPVRGITNLSSGKMGFALARAAREAGAKVTMVAGPTSLATPRGVRRIDVQTAQQMLDEVLAYIDHAQIFVSVAAVADWRVANPSPSKLKKTRGAPPALQFTPNPDILARVAALPNPPYCVGFAAESDDVIENARAKLASKGIPLVVANRAQDALGASDNEVHLVDNAGVTSLPRDGKLAQARRIVAEIARRVNG
ncbi:MAG TPA: bifunctional phosphopantothenoylcysteine decarboxylase/phosphopantothenate--cysteine ligase CoaBC [Burkholderiaceae bacterium]|nr:bifunctional phosphopantothenoylcysteine decarboxylase/phosphopantothenate--cysteine ligase CoaBC [Burkholderiaceae bacterium]